MNIGKFIRQCVSDYLNRPIILLPFAILGLLSVGIETFSKYYLHSNFGMIGGSSIQALIKSETIPFDALGVLSRYVLLVLVSLFFLSFISSFFHAFSIGLARKIALKKRPLVDDGFKTLDAGIRIFSFKVLIWIFTGIGALILILPATFLFGIFGAFFGAVCTVFFFLLLQFVGFFGKQAVVLDNLWAWAAFQRSYRVIRKNLENVLLLMGAYLFIIAAFVVFRKIFMTIANYIITGFGLVVFTQAADFIFTFLILAPIFIIIKTSYFMKNAPKLRKARAA